MYLERATFVTGEKSAIADRRSWQLLAAGGVKAQHAGHHVVASASMDGHGKGRPRDPCEHQTMLAGPDQ